MKPAIVRCGYRCWQLPYSNQATLECTCEGRKRAVWILTCTKHPPQGELYDRTGEVSVDPPWGAPKASYTARGEVSRIEARNILARAAWKLKNETRVTPDVRPTRHAEGTMLNTSETITEIAQALAKAQAEFKPVAKSGRNHEFRYTYADLDDYFAAVRPALAKHGLSLTTSVADIETLPERKTARGSTLYGARVRVVTRLIHTSGQWIEAAAFGEGLDTADKAVFKATTGARKYALASLLGLATTDDPERDEEPQGQPELGTPKTEATPCAEAALAPEAKPPTAGPVLATEAQRKRLQDFAQDQRLAPSRRKSAAAALQRETLTARAAADFIAKAETSIRTATKAA